MDFLAMRPSQWRALAGQEPKSELLQSLKAFFSQARSAEEAYTTGLALTGAGVWHYLPAKDVAKALSEAPKATINEFFAGIPEDVRQSLRKAAKPVRPQKARPVTGQSLVIGYRKAAAIMAKRTSLQYAGPQEEGGSIVVSARQRRLFTEISAAAVAAAAGDKAAQNFMKRKQKVLEKHLKDRADPRSAYRSSSSSRSQSRRVS